MLLEINGMWIKSQNQSKLNLVELASTESVTVEARFLAVFPFFNQSMLALSLIFHLSFWSALFVLFFFLLQRLTQSRSSIPVRCLPLALLLPLLLPLLPFLPLLPIPLHLILIAWSATKWASSNVVVANLWLIVEKNANREIGQNTSSIVRTLIFSPVLISNFLLSVYSIAWFVQAGEGVKLFPKSSAILRISTNRTSQMVCLGSLSACKAPLKTCVRLQIPHFERAWAKIRFSFNDWILNWHAIQRIRRLFSIVPCCFFQNGSSSKAVDDFAQYFELNPD